LLSLCFARIRSRRASTCSRTARNGKASRRPAATVLEETKKLLGPTRERDRTKIAELFADERCSQAILDFLATTDVGRTAGPQVAEEGEVGASEASEWADREREEQLALLTEEEERLGGEE